MDLFLIKKVCCFVVDFYCTFCVAVKAFYKLEKVYLDVYSSVNGSFIYCYGINDPF